MHFILVHGACHGQWCWYKLKPLIEGSGHRVTALDLSASGTNLQKIEDLKTMKDYTDPLLQVLGSLPAEEKVGIMGHSLGGLNLAVAMETFPEKILVAIFLSAFLPDTTHEPSFVVNQLLPTDADLWLDTKFSSYHVEEGDQLVTKFLFGPKFMALLYDSCPNEDLELAMMLKRPSSFFLHDLSKLKKFSAAVGQQQMRGFHVPHSQNKRGISLEVVLSPDSPKLQSQKNSENKEEDFAELCFEYGKRLGCSIPFPDLSKQNYARSLRSSESFSKKSKQKTGWNIGDPRHLRLKKAKAVGSKKHHAR